MPTAETLDGAIETLRRLSADIRAFRSQEVRNLLMSSPVASAERTPAELEVQLIALRTSLSTTEENLSATCEELSAAKAAAEKEREEAESLRVRLSAIEKQASDDALDAQRHIEDLEENCKRASQAAEENALLLKQQTLLDKESSRQLVLERDEASIAAANANSLAKRLERELRATKEEAAVEKELLDSQVESMKERIVELEEQLMKQADERVAVSQSTASMLNADKEAERAALKENVELKAELASRVEELVELRRSSLESTKELLELKAEHRKLLETAEEMPFVQEKIAKLEIASQEAQSATLVINALAKEKEQLSKLISALSPDGSVQEGLKILRNAAHKRSEGTNDPMRDVVFGGDANRNGDSEVNRVELARLSTQLSEYTHKLVAAEREIGTLTAQRDEAQRAISRDKRLRKILENERNYLKSTLAELDSEEKVSDPAAIESGAVKRYQAAEAAASDYKKMCDDLTADARQQDKKISDLSARLAVAKASSMIPANEGNLDVGLRAQLFEAIKSATKASEELIVAKNEETRVQEELRNVRKEAFLLRRQIQALEGPADYDKSTTKVLHYVNNPLDKARSALAEQEATYPGSVKKRQRPESSDIVVLTDNENEMDRTEVDRLKERLALLEQQNTELEKQSKVGKRTGEVAKRMIQQVRSAVYHVFGWSMRISGANFTFSSIFAERPDEELEFGVNDKGTMELHKTDYTDRIESEIEQFVHRMNSIPALMASITMENFEKTTAFAG